MLVRYWLRQPLNGIRETAMRYWWRIVRIAAGRACETIGWHHPRNAIIPSLTTVSAAVLVWYVNRDADALEGRLMIAGAITTRWRYCLLSWDPCGTMRSR